MALLKNYFEGFKQESPIIFEVTVEMAQDIIEANCGRELEEYEIERLHDAMLDNWDAQHYIREFIISAGEMVINDKEADWSYSDEKYESRKHTHYMGKYSIGKDVNK
jgi:hypothetical protein